MNYNFILIFIVTILGCNSPKNISKQSIHTKQMAELNQPYIFKTCPGRNYCPDIFDCYFGYFLAEDLFKYETSRQARNYFNFDSLRECTVTIYLTDKKRRDMADYCLYEFYRKVHIASIAENRSGMPIGNLENHTLKRWNSRKSFSICILLMSKNEHDSMGHGDCTNVGVKFFSQIVAPKIKTIYGQDLSDYLYKHLDYDNEKNYEDCFDSFYNTLYPLIKQAWEEGKIELHAPENK